MKSPHMRRYSRYPVSTRAAKPAAPATRPRSVAPRWRPLIRPRQRPGRSGPGRRLLEPGLDQLAVAGGPPADRPHLVLQRLGVVLVPPDQEPGSERADHPFPVVALLVVHSR